MTETPTIETSTPERIAEKLYKFDRVHTPIASPNAVRDADIAAFERDGFIAVANVFTPDEVASYKAAISTLVADGNSDVVTFEDGDLPPTLTALEREHRVRKVWQFCARNAVLKSMSEHPKLMRIVNVLVGSETTMIQDMALLKPPRGGREKPWHQDTAYFAITPPTGVIGTWTALDAATLENGCMHVIPGSNREGCRPHYHDRDCQLADEDVQVDRDVCVPLAPGGVLFFSGLLHHGTPPNFSTDRRRAIQLHYASVNCRTIEEHEHAALFADKLGYAGCRSWTGKLPMRPITSKPKDF